MTMDREQDTLVSRRMLFAAPAAALAGSTLASLPAIAAKEKDSELFSLVQEWKQEEARYKTRSVALDEADEQLWVMRSKGNASAQARKAFRAAREGVSESVERLHELEARIAHTRATTREGMILKARMVADDSAFDGIQSQIEKALEERFSTGQFLGLSLALDLLHLKQQA